MQFSFVALLAAVSAASAAHFDLGPGDLNQCLISCAISSAPQAGCTLSPSEDGVKPCICDTPAFTPLMQTCINTASDACPASDAKSNTDLALKIKQQLCGKQ